MSRETPTAPQEHTKEPWHYETHPSIAGIYGGLKEKGEEIIIASLSTEASEGNQMYPDAHANAARIVAAVNAVAGIPTEELTRLGLGGLAKIYADRNQSNA